MSKLYKIHALPISKIKYRASNIPYDFAILLHVCRGTQIFLNFCRLKLDLSYVHVAIIRILITNESIAWMSSKGKNIATFAFNQFIVRSRVFFVFVCESFCDSYTANFHATFGLTAVFYLTNMEDDVDIREKIFHNAVREYIVSLHCSFLSFYFCVECCITHKPGLFSYFIT